MITSVNMRPTIGMLYNMRFMSYEQPFALAEFVDNSIQSFLDNEEKIKSIDGEETRLTVKIAFENDALYITDNAGGISEENYQRAFSTGERRQKTLGLSEFGMGMKAAACWYANNWDVRSTALGESVQRTVSCDMIKILNSETDEVEVKSDAIDPDSHSTIIILDNLLQRPYGRGYTRIQEYLSSIYRLFLRDGQLQLHCFNKLLSYPQDTDILSAPHHSEMPNYDHIDDVPQESRKEWKVLIDFEIQGIRVNGFAALRGKGVARGAGFSLFRRKRLIVDNYLPSEIFGGPNSGQSQRLFGELHIEGAGVSFAKDRFNWDESQEEAVVEELKEKLEPLLDQARRFPYRKLHPKRKSTPEVDPIPKVNPISEEESTPEVDPTPEESTAQPDTPRVHSHIVTVEFQGENWEINLDTPLIYFIKLPKGNVIKIGITNSVRGLTQRKSGAQTYFVDDVIFLGVKPFDVGHNPEPDEQELLNRFGRANTERSGSELVWDTSEVREYIDENCDPADPYLRATRRS